MITVLTGENDFARLAELRRLSTDFVREHGDFGLEQLDASEVEFGRLLEVVSSLPFLAEKRMIIVHNLNTHKSANDKIEQLLDAVSDVTELIIVETKFDKRSTLYKILKKRTDFHEFVNLNEAGLHRWLVQETENRQGHIKTNDANYLIQRTGLDQMLLSNEIDKLLSYDANITRQSIDLLTEPLPQSSIFELLDTAFSGNKKRTMDLYDDQRKQQVEPQAIMGLIAWQVHVLAVVKFNEKNGTGAIASGAKMSPYTVNKALRLSRKMTTTQVKGLVQRALKLDVRLKSEQIDADDAVQHFLLTI